MPDIFAANSFFLEVATQCCCFALGVWHSFSFLFLPPLVLLFSDLGSPTVKASARVIKTMRQFGKHQWRRLVVSSVFPCHDVAVAQTRLTRRGPLWVESCCRVSSTPLLFAIRYKSTTKTLPAFVHEAPVSDCDFNTSVPISAEEAWTDIVIEIDVSTWKAHTAPARVRGATSC